MVSSQFEVKIIGLKAFELLKGPQVTRTTIITMILVSTSFIKGRGKLYMMHLHQRA